jgi:hypothetical protein
MTLAHSDSVGAAHFPMTGIGNGFDDVLLIVGNLESHVSTPWGVLTLILGGFLASDGLGLVLDLGTHVEQAGRQARAFHGRMQTTGKDFTRRPRCEFLSGVLQPIQMGL